MIWRIRRFFERLEKIVRFIPVIWRSSEWDWNGLLEVMQHQLRELRSCLENNRHVGDAKHVKKIRTCELLINRLLRADISGYCEDEIEKHNIKWGEINYSYKDTDNLKEWVLTRDKVKTPKDEKLEREEFMRIMNHRSYMEKQDIDYLFSIMRKNLTCWWD